MKTTMKKINLMLILPTLIFMQGCAIQNQVYIGNLNKVEKYVSKGGDINLLDSKGRSLLDVALERFEKVGADSTNRRMVEFLLEKGAVLKNDNINVENYLDAANNGLTKLVEYMLDNGIDINSKSQLRFMQNTALMLASQNSHFGTVSLLIKKGADLNIKDQEGHSAWMSAIRGRRINIALLLLKSGSEIPEDKAVVIPCYSIFVTSVDGKPNGTGRHSSSLRTPQGLISLSTKGVGEKDVFFLNEGIHQFYLRLNNGIYYKGIAKFEIKNVEELILNATLKAGQIYYINYIINLPNFSNKGTWNAEIENIWPVGEDNIIDK